MNFKVEELTTKLSNHYDNCSSYNFKNKKKIEKKKSKSFEKEFVQQFENQNIFSSIEQINKKLNSKVEFTKKEKLDIYLEIEKVNRLLNQIKKENSIEQKKKMFNTETKIQQDEKNFVSNDFSSKYYHDIDNSFLKIPKIQLPEPQKHVNLVNPTRFMNPFEKENMLKKKKFYDELDQKESNIKEKIQKWNQFYMSTANSFNVEFNSKGEARFTNQKVKLEFDEIPYETNIELNLKKKPIHEIKTITERKFNVTYSKSMQRILHEKMKEIKEM
jgi:hypothetical protein